MMTRTRKRVGSESERFVDGLEGLPHSAPIEAVEKNLDQITNRGRTVLASLVIGMVLFAMISNALPESRMSQLLGSIGRPVGNVLHVPQEWALFSPDPITTEIHVFASVDFADGSSRRWFPAAEQSRIGSAGFERWRRWETAIRLDMNEAYWPVTARHLVQRFTAESNPVVSVRLVRRWSEVAPLSVADDEREFSDYHFYEWDAVSATGRILSQEDQPL